MTSNDHEGDFGPKDLDSMDLNPEDFKDLNLDFDLLDLDGPATYDQKPKTEKKYTPKRRKIRQNSKINYGHPISPIAGLWGRLIRTCLWAALALTILGLGSLVFGYAYFSQDLPSVAEIGAYQPPTVTFIYSDDGHIIGEYSHEYRLPRPLAEIPLMVRQAFIAVEDANFYQHGGVNLLAVARAAWRNLSGSQLQGASTITQQLVRAFLLTSERTVSRKIREMILAIRLEAYLSKDEILYRYLNHIYLGQGAYGVEAAARTYFDKHVEQLTIAEAAMLAGITQSPEGKNPLKRPEEAKARQIHGIDRMLLVGFISPAEAQAAREEILSITGDRPNPNISVAPYFTEHVRRLLVEKLGEDSLYNDGWKIYTTVNLEDQRAADSAVARGLWEYARRRGWKAPASHLSENEIDNFIRKSEKKLSNDGLLPEKLYQAVVTEVKSPESEVLIKVGNNAGFISKKNLSWILSKGSLAKLLGRGDLVWVRLDETENPLPEDRSQALARITQEAANEKTRSFILESSTDVQAALLSMTLENGSVVAMVGGRDFRESQFNRATQSQRQPGSSFKPIVYTAAMDNGFTPGSIMIDGPVVIDDPGSGRRWKPLNSDRKFNGPMTLYSALVASRNLVSIKLLERVGFEALDKTARDMGITTALPHSPTVALGAHGIIMPELLSAYSSFPNLGRRVTPRYITRIEDRHGRVVATYEPDFHVAISPATACVLTSMLRGVVAQGTGSSVKPLKRPVGGKTGTTNDSSDAWFVGFTPEIVTAVWLGTDELKPRAVGEAGGKAAGPIFLYYMQEALKKLPIRDFIIPPDAELSPGGAYGICYKAGTIGTGISETEIPPTPEEGFLRDDFSEGEDGFLLEEMQ